MEPGGRRGGRGGWRATPASRWRGPEFEGTVRDPDVIGTKQFVANSEIIHPRLAGPFGRRLDLRGPRPRLLGHLHGPPDPPTTLTQILPTVDRIRSRSERDGIAALNVSEDVTFRRGVKVFAPRNVQQSYGTQGPQSQCRHQPQPQHVSTQRPHGLFASAFWQPARPDLRCVKAPAKADTSTNPTHSRGKRKPG